MRVITVGHRSELCNMSFNLEIAFFKVSHVVFALAARAFQYDPITGHVVHVKNKQPSGGVAQIAPTAAIKRSLLRLPTRDYLYLFFCPSQKSKPMSLDGGTT